MGNVTKQCVFCNAIFTPKRFAERAMYCQPSCKQKAYNKRRLDQTECEPCQWCHTVSVKIMDLYSGFCGPRCQKEAEIHKASGGECRKCGALWLGDRHCQKCGTAQNVTT